MIGTEKDRGLIHRSLTKLFQCAQEKEITHKCNITVSILEIYNENLVDLLDEKGETEKKLQIRTDDKGSNFVTSLTEHKVSCVQDILSLMKIADKNRSVGSTLSNEQSSRSHCVLTVHVVMTERFTNVVSKSQLNLVDLAGSERVDKSGAVGTRLKEATFINKSLSALGNVISSLLSSNKKQHVPYRSGFSTNTVKSFVLTKICTFQNPPKRDSKLTHLLQHSLSGNNKTLMIVQINPDSEHQQESLCSLRFASRVKSVHLGAAKKNVLHQNPHFQFQVQEASDKLALKQKELAVVTSKLESANLKISSLENQLKKEKQFNSTVSENYTISLSFGKYNIFYSKIKVEERLEASTQRRRSSCSGEGEQ